MTNTIQIGTFVRRQPYDQEPHIICQHAELAKHLDRPWMRAYLAHQLGVPIGQYRRQQEQAISVTTTALARHTLLCGATGYGKSCLVEHMLVEQLRQGCSAVVLDPKSELISNMLAHAEELGIAPEQVTLLRPGDTSFVPGWNPLNAGLPISQAASDFVAVLQQSTTSWGPRMQDLLTNALIIVGSNGLSLFELSRFVLREDYREALLRLYIRSSDPLAYEEARRFFVEEFGVWTRSERAQAVGPVLNKIRELLRSPFLQPLLCARRNTLDLSSLWKKQGLVLIHLDRTALGEEGTRLLAGMLSSLLFRTALRAAGSVPVVLSLDELATVEHFIGQPLCDIVTVARSYGLRLLVACQHLAQLSENLRAALLSNPAIQVFFRLGATDARLIASALAVGAEPRLKRLVANVEWEDRRYGQMARAEWRHPIRDASGRPLRFNAVAWSEFTSAPDWWRNPLPALRAIAGVLHVHRLYVLSPTDDEPIEITRYVEGLTGSDIRIDGPAPLSLIVKFPRPRVTRTERWTERDAASAWTRTIQDLPVQYAVIRITSGETKRGTDVGVVKIVDVAAPTTHSRQHEYRRSVLRANGQTAREIQDTLRYRQDQIERIASGRSVANYRSERQPIEDGSIA